VVTAAVLAVLAGVATQTSAKPVKAAAEPAYGATLVCPAGTSDPNYCTGSAGTSTSPSQESIPVFDSTANVVPLAGTILVELPGTDVFVLLQEGETIPLGSIIDARRGRVQITVTLPNGTTETGVFYDGEFKFTQSASGRVFLTLTGGSFAGCPSSTTHGLRSEATSASKKKKPKTVVRQLWGSAHGEFTTKGRYGSAAVSGTIWLTKDLCEGTYFKVTKDTIIVTAFAFPHKHHHLKQGQSFVIFGPGF
jgi:hypothetical protein